MKETGQLSKESVPQRKRVLIVGGGLAGLSAAEALARTYADRFEITLLEAKRSTGGRGGAVFGPATDEAVDYCQHVAMGCCTNLLGLLQRCGLSDSMRRFTELCFMHPGHPPSRFSPSRLLPAPFHLLRTLSALRYLDSKQRRQIRKGFRKLFRTESESLRSITASNWLRSQGQDAATIREFWSVIVVSALGESTDVVSMAVVRKVLVDGFAASRGASDLLVPQMPLAELVGDRLTDHVRQLGVRVMVGQAVRQVRQRDGAGSVETSDGAHYHADHVVIAVPWHVLARVVSSELIPEVEKFSEFPSSPITGVHLWFDREFTDRHHAVLVGTVSQWLFRQYRGNSKASPHPYYQVVISASEAARSIPPDELIETVIGELRQAFPVAKDANLVRSRIVTDPNAVFSIRPEVDAIRPSAATSQSWLHLAGDWIDTGWPATMEGAVISGRMAAASIAHEESLSEIEIEPGLCPGWLAKRLIKA